ncbi:MAG: AAA family ATPase [Patescibacteria group bacterium]
MLKNLEIQGFKSFPDKTVLEFPSGISAVVGPNGSGKSNIVDAIRWVFGEQSIKNIRASSSQEVIFNGAAGRPAGSLAWVNLVFDNKNKDFNFDFDQIEIKRKVYRDGNSEYFLNKKQIRLKDLIQALASARLGVKGMGIVNQGAGDVFLRANSLERREIIEEMIGLKEIRLKKQEAERKIKETRNNLAQTEVILKEIEPNLRFLKRQVNRWQSRQEKQNQLTELERSYFVEKICQLDLLIKGKDGFDQEAEAKVLALKKEISEKEQTFTQFQRQDPELAAKQAEIERNLSQEQKQKTEILRTLGKVEGQLDFLANLPRAELNFGLAEAKNKFEQVLRVLEDSLAESGLDLIKHKIQALLNDLKAFLTQENKQKAQETGSKKSVLEQEKQRLSSSLEKIEKTIQDLTSQLQGLRTKESEKNQEFQTLFSTLREKRTALNQMEDQLIRLKLEQEKAKLRQEDLKKQLAETGLDWDKFLVENQVLISEKKALAWDGEREKQLAGTEKSIFKLRQELFLIGETDSEVVQEYQSAAERYGFLSGQKKDLETALADLEKLSISLEEKIGSGFEAALKAIDKEFHQYFGIIFEGGRGALKIEKTIDPETQMIDFGIEIQVSLPRKKINSLEMLSGGERSLTAIAFLFAVINYAHPPFLVLDEIDAALDEANSQKLARLLKEIAEEKTQFILITHNRAVMETADVLYGVTMADGISKIFSLKFTEVEQLAGEANNGK